MVFVKNKSNIILLILFELIIIASAVYKAVVEHQKILSIALLAAVTLLIPFIIRYVSDKKKINLHQSFIPFWLLFIFLAQCLGEMYKFYLKLWWWDLLLHTVFGFYTAFLVFYFIQGIIAKDPKSTDKRYGVLIALFAFSFSIALGTVWELFETYGDYFFHTNMVKGGLKDTAFDLTAKVTGALGSVIFFYCLRFNLKR